MRISYLRNIFFLQIRKLYEPTKYESALIHPVFLEYFHRNITDLSSSLPYICAIGFEPNPNHEPMLKSKISKYTKIKIITFYPFFTIFLQI